MSVYELANFAHRHLGPRESGITEMLDALGYETLDELTTAAMPANIAQAEPLVLPEALTETQAQARLRELAAKNTVKKSMIGQGFYDTITPAVIRRNVVENPGWYTAYTPYQPEISQGRLEALLNFQTMVSDLTGMEIANATASDNEVTVIGMESVPLERVLGKEVGAGIRKLLEGKGVKFYMDAAVDKAEPKGSDQSVVGSVALKDGTKLEADLVILGVGVAPATGFLKENKVVRLEDDGSLKVDENYLVTGLKDVYAIGDIASFPYHGPGGQGRYTRIEHWNVAQNQGRGVARHIVNPSLKSEFFTPVFWSALTGQLRYCGSTAQGWDDLVLQGNPEEGKFVAYYCSGETVVAVASMAVDPAMAHSAQLIRQGAMPSKTELKGGLDILDVALPA